MKQASAAASKLLPLRLPLTISLVLVLIGGWFLLNRADAQARDTVRKHHLQDIEQSLYFARNVRGTFPPYDQPTWCGSLSDSANDDVRQQIEDVLRQQNDKYANIDKPFPRDPLTGRASPTASAQGGATGGRNFDYFYWKRSPAIFELYAKLETDPNAERSVVKCAGQNQAFDYGITSVWRESE